jgi:hypothetical protein
MRQSAVGPPHASAWLCRSQRRAHAGDVGAPCKHLGAIILAPGPLVGDGRRSVPPAERPIADVAAEKRRERPRLRVVDAAPRLSGGVAHAPHVGVRVGTGAPRS